jgi:hypothetical protein
MDWLTEAGADTSAYGTLAELTYFAVQSRYDDNLEIPQPDWTALMTAATALLHEAEQRLQ